MRKFAAWSFLNFVVVYSLPRLSSQRHFDELCPPSGTRSNRKLCAILLVRAGPTDEIHTAAFRDYAETRGKHFQTLNLRGGTVRFLYVYEDKQALFIESLSSSARKDETTAVFGGRHVVVVWRVGQERAKFDWFQDVWDGRTDHVNRSIDLIEQRLERILRNADADLVNSANLKDIVDENGPGLYKKLASKIMRSVESITHHLSKEEILPIVSVFGTLFGIMFVGWCLNQVA